MNNAGGHKHKAYLSYKRVNGSMTEFATKLMQVTPTDFKLNVDCLDADPSRPIDEFLSRLKTNPEVIFLLNRAYFESPWCMEELYAFLECRVLGVDGFFIATDDWLQDTEYSVFTKPGVNKFLEFWEKKSKESEGREKAIAVKIVSQPQMIKEELPQLDAFKHLNFREQKFYEISADDKNLDVRKTREIWGFFRANAKRKPYDLKIEQAETYSTTFCESVKDELGAERGKLLKKGVEADQKRSLREGWSQSETVDEALWKMPPEDALNCLYRSCRTAFDELNAATHANKAALFESLERSSLQLLGLLLQKFLDEGALHRLFQNKSPLDCAVVDIPAEQALLPGMLCFRLNTARSQEFLTFNKEKKKLTVNPKHQLHDDLREVGRGSTRGDAFDRHATAMWKRIMPGIQNDDDLHYLTQQDWERLNKMMRKKFERGEVYYYALNPAGDCDHPFIKFPAIASALKYRLPYLFIFRLGADTETPIVQQDLACEAEIHDELNAFAELFARYLGDAQ